jgi:hypothetical protein
VAIPHDAIKGLVARELITPASIAVLLMAFAVAAVVPFDRALLALTNGQWIVRALALCGLALIASRYSCLSSAASRTGIRLSDSAMPRGGHLGFSATVAWPAFVFYGWIRCAEPANKWGDIGLQSSFWVLGLLWGCGDHVRTRVPQSLY